MAQHVLFAPGAPAHVVSLGMQELRSCRTETIMDDLEAARAMDLTSEAMALEVPTLVVCGNRDRLTPPALSEHLSALIPRSRLRIVEGAGHMLLLEVPDRVNQDVLSFAESLTVGGRPSTPVPDRGGRSLVRRFLDWGHGLVGTAR
jgi:pimeloyl-ACP methyl ester carboxylesterase